MDHDRARETRQDRRDDRTREQRHGLLPQGVVGELPRDTPAQREWAAFLENQRMGYGSG